MEASGSSVRVFDGTSDFRVWRARVENELMRYHLLGYVLVKGYNGSQPFEFNGEKVPPRCPVINVDSAHVKEEAGTAQTEGLSRWDVLGECAEAKSILQRFLHPDVESAILNKNVYDSWQMLCALYGNRSTPGANDVYEMHRVMHHMRLGDKKGEAVREFVTRWEMVARQYATATGIELTDSFRSVMFSQTLPRAWRSKLDSWRGIRPFVPYAELVEKVVAEDKRLYAADSDKDSKKMEKPAERSIGSPSAVSAAGSVDGCVEKETEKQMTVKPVETPAVKSVEKAAKKLVARPVKEPVEKPSASAIEKLASKSSAKPVDKIVYKIPTKKATAKTNEDSAMSDTRSDASDEKSTTSKVKPMPLTLDLSASPPVSQESGEVLLSTKSSFRSTTSSVSTPAKSPARQPERATAESPHSDRSSKHYKESSHHASESSDKYDSYKRDSHATYSTSSRHSDESPRYHSKSHSSSYSSYNRYNSNNKYNHKTVYEQSRYNNNSDSKRGLPSCFYCLKVGHTLRQCWFLKADIDKGATHDGKRYSCTETIDRPAWMVEGIEKYIDEVNEARHASRRDSDYRADSNRDSSTPTTQASYGYQEQQLPLPDTTNYRKRSRSVFQPAENRVIPSRDPRLQRSRSMFRSTDVQEDTMPPRKRPYEFSFGY